MLLAKLIILCFSVRACTAQFLECTEDQECQANGALCQSDLCQCPVGTVYSVNGTMCLPVSLGFNSPCEENLQCGWLLGNYECVDNKCACANGWMYVQGRCVKKSSLNRECVSNDHCFNGYDLLAMVCKNSKCVCNDGYYNRDDFDCRPAITVTGEYCSLNSDCTFENGVCQNSFCVDKTGSTEASTLDDFQAERIIVKDDGIDPSCDTCSTIPNAMCHSAFKKCYCKRGFYYDSASKSCIGELGTDIGCTDDSQCLIPYSRCENRKCYCRKSYFTISSTGCQKPMTHDNFFCNTPERCYTLGPYSKCERNKCQCSLPVEPNPAFICEAPKVCLSDADCTDLKHSVCANNTCQCLDGFHIMENACFPNLGTECIEQCTISNASCDENNFCSCNDQFVENGDMTCLPFAELNADCEISAQCTGTVKDSECVNSKCKCKQNFGVVNGTCLQRREMGDACETMIQCKAFLGPNVVCRNGYCKCPADMVPNDAKTDCVSAAGILSLSYSLLTLLIVCINVI